MSLDDPRRRTIGIVTCGQTAPGIVRKLLRTKWGLFAVSVNADICCTHLKKDNPRSQWTAFPSIPFVLSQSRAQGVASGQPTWSVALVVHASCSPRVCPRCVFWTPGSRLRSCTRGHIVSHWPRGRDTVCSPSTAGARLAKVKR